MQRGPTERDEHPGVANGVWREIVPAIGGASVSMPGTPEIKHWTPDLPVPVPETLYAVQTADRGIVYTLNTVEFPPKFFSPERTLLENLRQEARHASALHGDELTSWREEMMTLPGDVPALEFWASGPGPLRVHGRCVILGDRAYDATVMYRDPVASSVDLERFIGSFRVTGVGPAGPVAPARTSPTPAQPQ